jgi:hypothetical protein
MKKGVRGEEPGQSGVNRYDFTSTTHVPEESSLDEDAPTAVGVN